MNTVNFLNIWNSGLINYFIRLSYYYNVEYDSYYRCRNFYKL